MEARGGAPDPERWYILVYDGTAQNGVHEFVVADGQVVASRALSQFADSLMPDDVIDASAIKTDSAQAAKQAGVYAGANGVSATSINYELKKSADNSAPAWKLSCLNEAGDSIGEIVITAARGEVVSHSGFAHAPKEAASAATPRPARHAKHAEVRRLRQAGGRAQRSARGHPGRRGRCGDPAPPACSPERGRNRRGVQELRAQGAAFLHVLSMGHSLQRRLARLVGADSVRADAETLAIHSRDRWFASALPEVVALPATTEAVAKILAFADREKIPLTARGAGVGYVGGCVPSRGGIALSLARMNRIKEIHRADGVAVVEPGVITGELQARAREQGLFYPPDPASLNECSLGGNIATNAGGPRCLKYGVTRNYVLGLEVVLAGGDILRTGGRTHKNKTGFDLIGMFVGSEGLLGVVTEAILRLLPLPPARAVLSASFPYPAPCLRRGAAHLRRRLPARRAGGGGCLHPAGRARVPGQGDRAGGRRAPAGGDRRPAGLR